MKKNNNISLKKAPHKKKLNPFEVHINRQKYDVLGKKLKKDRGLPGISRSKAIKKRKATLLQEYKLKDKNNKFYDRRIGEKNSAMTLEDKIMARFAAQRLRAHSKKTLYNLGDNEVLTHRGESLADIEQFEDPKSDDEEDDETNPGGKLGKEYVEGAHFGGGMFRKIDNETHSRKDLIEQLIAESKTRKAEKQKVRQEMSDLTEKLDEEWKDLYPVVASKKTKLDDIGEVKSERTFASYDMLSKQLRFEARGRAQDKLKSEEELARQEKERLEKLEQERLKRMSNVEITSSVKHRSADDLDDGFDYIENEEISNKRKRDTDDTSDGSPSDDEEIEEKKDNSTHDESSGSESDGESENESGDSASDSYDDDLSDLKLSENESDVEPEPQKTVRSKKQIQQNSAVNVSNELPFTFDLPSTYESFEGLLMNHTVDEQGIIVARIIKSNHPSLQKATKSELTNLLAYILQYLQDSALDDVTKFTVFHLLDKLSGSLFDLTQFAPNMMTAALIDVIKEKYEDFVKRQRNYPQIDTLIFLKVVSILYPTSDFRHRLVTPSLTFILQILSSCRIQNTIDLSRGLFLCTLALEYTAFAKRLAPEAINFLRGVLTISQPLNVKKRLPPPFNEKCCLNLFSTSSIQIVGQLGANNLSKMDNTEQFKVNAVSTALNILLEFIEFNQEPSSYLIFQPFIELLRPENYNEVLRPRVRDVSEKIQKLDNEKLVKLAFERKRPKPLKLYEPKIEEVYTFKKRRPMSKEKQEHEKLLHKYKKEVKGALREIRQDRTFISKIKFKEAKASDMERKKKVKEIYNEAAQQMGDLRKIKKSK